MEVKSWTFIAPPLWVATGKVFVDGVGVEMGVGAGTGTLVLVPLVVPLLLGEGAAFWLVYHIQTPTPRAARMRMIRVKRYFFDISYRLEVTTTHGSEGMRPSSPALAIINPTTKLTIKSYIGETR